MDIETFKQQLIADGYLEIVDKTLEPGTIIDTHTHPFDVRALVLEGEATITCHGEAPRTFRPGDILELEANRPHSEHYGPNGYRFLVGRRYPA
jgi:quercetin dioxygenase-like cupin family protein